LNVKKLPGKPDIVIGKHKLAIFVDGEFWHGYDWKAKKPKIKSDAEYWVKKIEGNMARDQNNNEKLRSQGFLVLRFWEQELRKDIDGCVRQILKAADTRTT
jgi:DNA mismatch endonuclease (patch repair protein)